MGIATTNEYQRVLARIGALEGVAPNFGNHNGVAFGGVLFLLPALLSQGLMTIKDTHKINEGYYKLESIILTLAFMALCRIKNPEQLKHCAPGEFGKLIGLDRVPELKCLRNKMSELFDNKKTDELMQKLSVEWNKSTDEELLLYTDGHVKIYNGSKATLSKKFISRQKLCLPATSDFWLHDAQGLPLMVWTGELSEKLQYMIEQEMIPKLLQSGLITKHKDAENETPICTLIFDREAYQPIFFQRLWDDYRIAIITYRKNVKDRWDTDSFVEYEIIDKLENKKTMLLCEKPVELNGCKFREIRCLTTREHQTALITNHPTMILQKVAPALFNRWQQENFFKYMISDYSLDHLIEYGIEHIDLDSKVVNPAYRSITHLIKKEREKMQRLKAKLLNNISLYADAPLDQFEQQLINKAELVEQIKTKEKLVQDLAIKKLEIKPKIKLSEMPEKSRITKLKTESAFFMSTIKMICYRAESAIANLLSGIYSRYTEEKRMLIKNIILSPADIIPDHINNTLTIKLHSLNTPKANQIVTSICTILNETCTQYPGTDLRLIYKTVAN